MNNPSLRPVLLVLALTLACVDAGDASTAPTIADAGETGSSERAPTAIAEHSFRAVRVDPASFVETELGLVEIDPQPPFTAKVIRGGDELRRIVDQQNRLDAVSSAGFGDEPGTRIPRTSHEFLPILRAGWLTETHHISLRSPATTTRAPVRRQLLARGEGEYELLGVVELGDNDYVRIVDGPTAQRRRLGELLHAVNDQWSFQQEMPPPAGARGSWGRVIRRGTAEYREHQRDKLLAEGFLLLPESVDLPRRVTTETRFARSTVSPWLSIDVSGGFIVTPASDASRVELSGPPGGPSSIFVGRYSGVRYDAEALREHVEREHGGDPEFIAGRVGEVELAERELLAMSFRSGGGFTAANHVAVLWPQASGPGADAPPSDGGVLVLVTSGGRHERDAADVLGAPNVAPVLASLVVDFDQL
jgi:hypothetical protein